MPKPNRHNLVLMALLVPCAVAALGASAGNWRVFGIATAAATAIGITLVNLDLRRTTAMQTRVKTLQALAKREGQRRHAGFSRVESRLTTMELTARQASQRTTENSNRAEVIRQTILDRFEHNDAQLADLGRNLEHNDAQLADLGRTLGQPQLRTRQESFSSLLQRLADDSRLNPQYIVSEIDALGLVNRQFPLGPERPVLAGWAMTPRGILQVTSLINSRRPRLTVECGSGASTIYAALALRELGSGGRLVALEHLADVVEAVNEQLATFGLSEFAEVCHAPLVRFDERDGGVTWYSLEPLRDLNAIDMLIVDGPPGTVGPLARVPAFPLLRDRLSAHALIVLDDADRDDERAVVRQWLTDPALERARSATRDHAVLVWREMRADSERSAEVSSAPEATTGAP